MDDYGGREGENKGVVKLRSGMKQDLRVSIVRSTIVDCSIFAGPEWSAERVKNIAYVISLIFGRIAFQCRQDADDVISTSFPLPTRTELSFSAMTLTGSLVIMGCSRDKTALKFFRGHL